MGVHKIGRRAVFLDRDGIINRSIVRDGLPYPPASASELEFTPGIENTLRTLKDAGWFLVIVTNQPDVARGTTTRESVEEIHSLIRHQLPVDAVYACYHDSGEGCECRKPRPGMLLTAAREMNLDLSSSFMVGDRWRDIDAGNAAGCHTIFVDYGYREALKSRPDYVIDAPQKMTDIILQQKEEKGESNS